MSKLNYLTIIIISLSIGTMGFKTYKSINNLQKKVSQNRNKLNYALNNNSLTDEENSPSTNDFSNLELDD